MIHLFVDFGHHGPYVGEVEAVLRKRAPEVPVVPLMCDAPAFRPELAAVLLAALARRFRSGDVCLAVVDPGVGTARRALALACDGIWFVGPDNGLFEHVLRHATETRSFLIRWRPPQLSASFHGRDLFAPVAAALARGREAGLEPTEPTRYPDWPDDLAAVVYIDAYGNAMTGIAGARIGRDSRLRVCGTTLGFSPTFGAVPPGQLFWYVNSAGLVEIAANGDDAARRLGLEPGTPVEILDGPQARAASVVRRRRGG